MKARFLIDESAKKREELINKIQEVTSFDISIEKNAEALLDFTRALCFASEDLNKKRNEKLSKVSNLPPIITETLEYFPKREYSLEIYNSSFGSKILAKAIVEKKGTKVYYTINEAKCNLKLLLKVDELIYETIKKNPEKLAEQELIINAIKKACSELGYSYSKEKYFPIISYYLKRNYLGFGRVSPLIKDVNVKAIKCNGVNKTVLVDYEGVPYEVETNITFTHFKEINRLIKNLAENMGKSVSDDHPLLKGVYKNFSIKAVYGSGNVEPKFVIAKGH